jgi:DUF1009 family protein
VIAYNAELQDKGVKESAGFILGVVAAPKTDNVKDMPSENEFRELLANAVKAIIKQTGKSIVIKANAALFVKRSRDTR